MATKSTRNPIRLPVPPSLVPIQVNCRQTCNSISRTVTKYYLSYLGYSIGKKPKRLDKYSRHFTFFTNERSNGNKVYMGL